VERYALDRRSRDISRGRGDHPAQVARQNAPNAGPHCPQKSLRVRPRRAAILGPVLRQRQPGAAREPQRDGVCPCYSRRHSAVLTPGERRRRVVRDAWIAVFSGDIYAQCSAQTTPQAAADAEESARQPQRPRGAITGEWCNGSTKDSDSFSLGSNPSSPASFSGGFRQSRVSISTILGAVDTPVSTSPERARV
jgi:hypothetical protein